MGQRYCYAAPGRTLIVDNPGFGNILEIVVCPFVSPASVKEALTMHPPDSLSAKRRSPGRRSWTDGNNTCRVKVTTKELSK